MKHPKKLSDYIHFITIIYGGIMNRNGVIDCIIANSLAYANGMVTRNTYLKAEKHFEKILKNI